MTDIEAALRDELRQVSSSVDPSDQFLARTLAKSQAGHPRAKQVFVLAASVLATAAVVAGFITLRSQRPDPVTVDLVAIDPAINLACDRPASGADLAPSQQELSRMNVVAMTVCKSTNPSTGDPDVDFHSTLAGESDLGQSAADDVMAVLIGAPRSEPGSVCVMIDSPPPLTYSIRVQDADGAQWGVRVSSPSCLGLNLSGGRKYESGELLTLLGGLVQDE